MATFNSEQYEAAHGQGNVSPRKILPSDLAGRVRSAYAHHGGVSGLASGDFINLFTLPKGARVLQVNMIWDDFGSSVQVDIGYEGDNDRFVDGRDVSASAGSSSDQEFDKGPLDRSRTIRAEFKGSGNPSDTADLDVNVLYVMD